MFDPLKHPDIEMKDLPRVQDLKVICEGQQIDADGAIFYIYTIGGTLDGNPIETADHVRREVYGATVGGDAIFVHGKSRAECDDIAQNGVLDTIVFIRHAPASYGLAIAGNEGTIIDASIRNIGSTGFPTH